MEYLKSPVLLFQDSLGGFHPPSRAGVSGYIENQYVNLTMKILSVSASIKRSTARLKLNLPSEE